MALTDGEDLRATVGPVETTLMLHKDLPEAKTPHEAEPLQRRITATDGQPSAEKVA